MQSIGKSPWSPGILTNRLIDGIGQLVTAHVNRPAKHFVGKASIVFEHGYRLRNIFRTRQRVWFAIVPGIDGCQNILVPLTKIGQLPQKIASLCWGQATPIGRPERRSGSLDSGVDVFLFCGCDLGDDRFVVGINRFDGAPRLGWYEFVVDEQACLEHQHGYRLFNSKGWSDL